MMFLDYLSNGETPINLDEAAQLLPSKRTGTHVSVRTLERYIREGFGPADLAKKAFLEAAKIGSTFVTSREAVQRFVYACSLADQERYRLQKLTGENVDRLASQLAGSAAT